MKRNKVALGLSNSQTDKKYNYFDKFGGESKLGRYDHLSLGNSVAPSQIKPLDLSLKSSKPAASHSNILHQLNHASSSSLLELTTHSLSSKHPGAMSYIKPKLFLGETALTFVGNLQSSKKVSKSPGETAVCASIGTGVEVTARVVGNNRLLKAACVATAPESLGTSLGLLAGLSTVGLMSNQLGNSAREACHGSYRLLEKLDSAFSPSVPAPKQ